MHCLHLPRFYMLTLVQVMRMTAVGIVCDSPLLHRVSDLNMSQIMAQLGMLVPAKSARYAQSSSDPELSRLYYLVYHLLMLS